MKIIHSLVARKYNYKSQPKDQSTFGFIAEEVEPLGKEFVIYENGKPYALNYNAFIPVIVEYLKQNRSVMNDIISKCKELETSISKQKEVNSLYSQSNINAENTDKTQYAFYAVSGLALLLSVIKFFL